MAITATSKGSGTYQIAPAGTHIARCVQVIDIGTQIGDWQGKEKRTRIVRIAWELPEEMAVFNMEKGEEPFIVGKEFTLSLKEKSTLRKELQSWRGKAFTNEELEGFDLSKLLGVPCLLTIVHEISKKSGKSYAKIAGVAKLGKNMTCPVQMTPSIEYSIDQGRNDTFQSLPEWLQDKCKACLEWTQPQTETRSEPEHDSEVPEATEADDMPF